MDLVERIRALLPDAQEKRMFGSVAFMVEAKMAVAAGPDGLLVRVDRDERQDLLARPGVQEQVMGQRVMRGWVHVEESAVTQEHELAEWVARGAAAARAAGAA